MKKEYIKETGLFNKLTLFFTGFVTIIININSEVKTRRGAEAIVSFSILNFRTRLVLVEQSPFTLEFFKSHSRQLVH